MADFRLQCPDCGGAIRHECGAKSDATVAQSVAQLDANPEIAHGSEVQIRQLALNGTKPYNQGYDQDFLNFWRVYPLRRDKRKAQIAWRKSVSRLGANRDAAMAQIIAGAIRYRDDPNRLPEFTKYAEGWLNADGWEDEPLPARRGKTWAEHPLDAMARRHLEGVNRADLGTSGGSRPASARELPGGSS